MQVIWETTTEVNTTSFAIERGNDEKSFSVIGNEAAKGIGANQYDFTDNAPFKGTNYYRLKMIDKDGNFSYSNVVEVQLTADRLPLTVFPNPSKDKITISGSHIATVQVVDNMGRVVKVISLHDASNPSLSLRGLQAGIYHLRIVTSDGKVGAIGMVKGSD